MSKYKHTSSMIVKTFKEKEIKKLLKTCDPYLVEYIESLKRNLEGWKEISQKAIKKLKEETHGKGI